jgi:hypothetical protein
MAEECELQGMPSGAPERGRRLMQPRDRRGAVLNTVAWGVVFIWAGVAWLADRMGWLAGVPLDGDTGLRVFLVGFGVIGSVAIAVRLLVHRTEPTFDTYIVTVLALALAFGDWPYTWPLVLVGLGLALMLRVLLRPMDRPGPTR